MRLLQFLFSLVAGSRREMVRRKSEFYKGYNEALKRLAQGIPPQDIERRVMYERSPYAKGMKKAIRDNGGY